MHEQPACDDDTGGNAGALNTGRVGDAPRWTVGDTVACALLLLFATTAVWPDLFTGWNYADDGGMAQVAERVLRGQLPHRDFEDPWSGGWSYFQALLFHLFGSRLSVLRGPIFVAWLGALLVVQRLARRAVSPAVSLVVGLACGAWSLYAYHLPLLNWYYAPLALIACWCVYRFEESHRRRWLLAAGACAGASILVKITGLFTLAALLLWCADWAGRRPVAAGKSRGLGFAALLGVVLSGYVAAVLVLLRGMPAELFGSAAVHFLLPQVLLTGWLVRRVARGGLGARPGIGHLLHVAAPLLAGVLLALAPFVLHYVRAGAVADLLVGLFVRPAMRLQHFAFGPPGRLGTALALAAPLVFFAGLRFVKPVVRPGTPVLALLFGAVLGAATRLMFGDAVNSTPLFVRSVPIVLPLVGLLWEERTDRAGEIGSGALLLVALTVTSQLVQVPFAWYPYFLYVAPIGILATFALLSSRGVVGPAAALFWSGFLLIGGVDHVPGSALANRTSHLAQLPFRRGGLEVSVLDSARYARVADIVASRPPGPLFVVGDVPELQFLLERENPGPLIYDVITDSAGRNPAAMLAMLDRAQVLTAVIKHWGPARDSLSRGQMEALRVAFPYARVAWKFEVRWRARVGNR